MRSLLVSLCTAAALLAPLASASNVDPIYYQSQGKVILPNLKFGTATYFVMLRQIPGTLNFSVDLTTLTLLLPANFTPASATDIIGSFSVLGPTVTLTLNANGTYSVLITDNPDNDPECPKSGGLETGTYQYEPTTGVFTTQAVTDANGTCGLSHVDAVVRLKKDGTKLYLKIKEDGVEQEVELIRK